MSFIEKNLLTDEKLIYYSKMHWIIFSLPVFMLILAILFIFSRLGIHFSAHLPYLRINFRELVSLIFFAVAVLTGIDSYISYETSEYGITNKRILIKTGWIRRNTLELFLDKVEALNVNQSIPGRILGYGTLRVVGTGGTEDPFFYIPNPLQFRKIAQQQVELHRTSNSRSA
jgi:uncharacterized membrane protein YdbT with pleckstrin-like domain